MSLVSHDERRPGLVLRALRQADRSEWDRVRNANLHYVGQWEPTAPDGVGRRITFRQYVKSLDREARAGRIVPFLIEADGRIAGQMHLFGIVHGSLLSGAAGYWVAEEFAGHGVATRALAMLCDYAFGPLALHRVEVNVRPENAASLVRRGAPAVPGRRCTRAVPPHQRWLARPPDLRVDERRRRRVGGCSTAGRGHDSPDPRRVRSGAEPARHTSHTGHISDTPLWVRDPRAHTAYRRFRAAQQPDLPRHRGDLGCLPGPALGPSPRAPRDGSVGRQVQ